MSKSTKSTKKKSTKAEKKPTMYWDGATVATGAHLGKDGAKTARTIGRSGAWTLKMRRKAGCRVGCIFVENADEKIKETTKGMTILVNGEMVAPTHVAVTDYGSVMGASSRKKAIELCKLAHLWCEKAQQSITDASV